MTSPGHPRPANRLIGEKSPYLLQHAHNPVDWYPWGPEAFAKAKKEDKPLLVSIGYSTCHWCHVMERESFENPEIAAVMNDHVVAVKVDREERPDVDKIYMTAVQAMTGQGGWPLNMFLTPDGHPFMGGTYFPPRDGGGRPGWPTLVRRIGDAWRDPEGRKELTGRGRQLIEGLTRYLSDAPPPAAEAPALPGAEALVAALTSFQNTFDAAHGGFSGAPKFPMPVYHHLILRAWAARPDELASHVQAQSLETLRRMAAGGIYDHLGGGFARYSVDERWHVPHFEKMLYDNAQLAAVYTEAFQVTGEAGFAAVAKETLEYVLRDMTHPEGGFYSAEDADSLPSIGASVKTEGAFYVWEADELERVLGPARTKFFTAAYGVAPQGNVAQDPHGEFVEKNVLYRALTAEQTAARFGVPPEEMALELAAARRRLFDVRAARPRPHLDDKVLASWNGLMISAFARAGRAFDEPRYRDAAVRAGDFILKNLVTDKGLHRRWRDGQAAVPAMADDVAFLAQSFLDLYEATLDVRWLKESRALARRLIADFQDPATGDLFMSRAGHDPLVPLRTRDDGDNVEPAAVSVAVLIWLRLAAYFDDADFRAAAEKALTGHAPIMAEEPRRFPALLAAALFHARGAAQVVIAGEASDPGTKALWREVNRRFLPFAVVLPADGAAAQAFLAERLPLVGSMGPKNGSPTAYVCQDFTCREPVSDPAALGKQLSG